MIAEYQIYETEIYAKWFSTLKDERAKALIAGGSKRNQQADINKAVELAREV